MNYFAAVSLSNSAQTAVSAGRAVEITSASRTHYLVDLIGYLV